MHDDSDELRVFCTLTTISFLHPIDSMVQVLFHPMQPAVLASGSEDGLVCMYNTGACGVRREGTGCDLIVASRR